MAIMNLAGRVQAKRLTEVAERLYEEKLRSKLEPHHKGEILVIDADSGDYFLGENLLLRVNVGGKI